MEFRVDVRFIVPPLRIRLLVAHRLREKVLRKCHLTPTLKLPTKTAKDYTRPNAWRSIAMLCERINPHSWNTFQASQCFEETNGLTQREVQTSNPRTGHGQCGLEFVERFGSLNTLKHQRRSVNKHSAQVIGFFLFGLLVKSMPSTRCGPCNCTLNGNTLDSIYVCRQKYGVAMILLGIVVGRR